VKTKILMFVFLTCFVLASYYASHLPLHPAPPLVPVSAFMKGVAYTSWSRNEYISPQSDTALLRAIKPMGVNWISLLVTCYQDNISSTHIQCSPKNTPSDYALTHAIQYAHSIGIRVMLKPHIDLSNDYSHWRGEIDFGSDETSWNTWFESYTNFITHYAALAQKTDVDFFVVGTELSGASHRADEWRAVTKAVRSLYHGPLTYAANWRAEDSILWWDAVNAIGIDAHYPLTQSSHPTVTQLKAAWAPIAAHLGSLSKKWNRSIIFTEIGYRSIRGANKEPYDWQVSQPVDLQQQVNCYQAVFEALAGKDWWHGVFWWNWDTNPLQGGPTHTD
jgi:hypothetical protein